MDNKSWTAQNTSDLYNLDKWSEGYFQINENGNLCVATNIKEEKSRICIKSVIDEMNKKGIKFPAVIRFHDILRSQVIKMNETFKSVIAEANYTGSYFGVYPVKVNQMRDVVEEIIDAGKEYNFGLEAGSKAELVAALAKNSNKNSLTILNGYKDEEYLKLALLGNQIGKTVIVVIEKFSELTSLIRLSKSLNVKPLIGFRLKLSTKGSGKWANSGGYHAKFGLTTSELLEGVKLLESENLLDSLKLLHFHIGSQITNIRTIKDAITEAARFYAGLVKLGAKIEFFDAGGGVGIDYEGTRSDNSSSINYNLTDYISDVVYILKDICGSEGVKEPNIVTESGRVITAHHSCLVTNVFGTIKLDKKISIDTPDKNEHRILKNIKNHYKHLKQDNYLETYNDALSVQQDAINAFKLGVISISERAKVEEIFWAICNNINTITKNEKDLPPEIESLKKSLVDQYLCNFSVFQSAADTWAIDQVLPIMPIQRLNEEPTNFCTIADITCDSDGKIDHFCGRQKSSLPIHEIEGSSDPYYVGLFLTGAYQDIMGDMHNLFGRVNEVHVYQDSEEDNNFYIEEIINGNNIGQVLNMMQYNPEMLAFTMKSKIDQQVKDGVIKPRIGVEMNDFYESCLSSYTYLS